MTESRGDNLREGGTQRACPICNPTRLHSQLGLISTGDMAEFVNHSTLLCHHQQQQEAYGLEHLSHSNWYRPLPELPNAIRILSSLQHLWRTDDSAALFHRDRRVAWQGHVCCPRPPAR